MKRKAAHNKKYMTIAVSVQTCWFSARNNRGGVRQESTPQSATAYISVRYLQAKNDHNNKNSKDE